jgi:hypothetical protein
MDRGLFVDAVLFSEVQKDDGLVEGIDLLLVQNGHIDTML